MKIFLTIFLSMCLLQMLFAANIWRDILSTNIKAGNISEGQKIKCGFHQLMNAYRNGDVELYDRIGRSIKSSRMQMQEAMISPRGHFRINYDLSGFHGIPLYDRDQNGISDYLEFVARSFDRAWEIEIETLGFRRPLDHTGQPKTVYDIFCRNLRSEQIYAATIFYLDEKIEGVPGNAYPSYIEISTDFSDVSYPGITDGIVRDSMAIAVTAAHEFNHACHLSYNIWNGSATSGSFDAMDLWYIENSATFMEEVVCNEINDYYEYLEFFFNTTDRGLIYYFPEDRIYGAVVLNIMLGQLYGNTITREVWERIVEEPAVGALDYVLQNKGTGLDIELRRLAEWMFFTGQNAAPDKFFTEAENYPQPPVIATEIFLDGSSTVYTDRLPPLAFQYLETAIFSDPNLNIYLVPENFGPHWSGIVFNSLPPAGIGFPAKTYYQVAYDLITGQSNSLYSSVTSGLWNNGNANLRVNYSLNLREMSSELAKDILVYPNLVTPEQNIDYVTFKNLPQDSRIEIYSGNGYHISTVYSEFTSQTVYWNLETPQGKKVGSGVYFYKILSPKSVAEGKIIVVR